MSTTVRIVKTPDVLHGKPRIEGTRVGVFQLGEFVHAHGNSLEDVVCEFDVDRARAEAALEYYEEHPELMETLRAQHEARRWSIREASRQRSYCGSAATRTSPASTPQALVGADGITVTTVAEQLEHDVSEIVETGPGDWA